MHRFPSLTCPLSLAVLLFLAHGLAACGGGGGGGADAPAGPVVPPQAGETVQVVRVHPAPDATDVDEATVVEVDFDVPLDPASVGATPILVRDDFGDVAGTATYIPETNRIRFVPDAPLALGTRLRARTTPGLEDVDGNPRNDEYEWTFCTRLPQPGPGPNPYEISPEHHVLIAFQLNKQGQGWAVWTQGESGGVKSLVAKRYGAGLGAGNYTLRTAPDIRAAEYSLVVNERGDALLAYTEDAGGQRNAYVHRYDGAAGAWSGRTIVDNSSSYTVTTPRLALAETGDGIVLCSRAPTGTSDYRVWVCTYRAGSGWTSGSWLSSDQYNASSSRVAINDDGTGLLAWSEDVSGYDRTVACTWSASLGFGAADPIAAQAGLDFQVGDVAVDPDGYGYVAYIRGSGSGERAFMRQHIPAGQPGAGWQGARPLHGSDLDNVVKLYALIAEDKTANFALKTDHAGVRTMLANRYQRGVGMGAATVLQHFGVEAQSDHLVMAAGPAGQVTYAYGADMPGGDLEILATSYVPGEGWQPPVVAFRIVSPDHFDVLRLAARSSGDVYVLAEYELDGGSGDEVLVGRWVSPTGVRGPQDDIATAPGFFISQVRFQIDGMGYGSVLWAGKPQGELANSVYERSFR